MTGVIEFGLTGWAGCAKMLFMEQKGLFLGIDAGGTKTVVRIVDETGALLGEGVSGGANQHNQGLEEALSNIGLALLSAKEQAEKKLGSEIKFFKGSCMGMAGLDTEDDRAKVVSGLRAGMLENWCSAGLLLSGDGLIGLRSGIEENFGVCIISGTGSNVYGIDRDGKEAHAGDWGFLLGDQGSGFAMGQKLLQQVMKEHDGRAVESGLGLKMLKFLNLRNFTDLTRWAYSDPLPVREIASLTHLLEDEELRETLVAELLIDEGVKAQGDAYKGVVSGLNLGTVEFSVVLSGGLMNLTARIGLDDSKLTFADKLKEVVMKVTSQVKVVLPNDGPVEGALVLARELPEFKNDEFYKKMLVEW